MNRRGLGFLVKMNLSFKISGDLVILNEGKMESFLLELVMNNKKLLVDMVNRSPSARLEEFFDCFEESVSYKLDFICMKYFNFNLLDFRADNFDVLILRFHITFPYIYPLILRFYVTLFYVTTFFTLLFYYFFYDFTLIL